MIRPVIIEIIDDALQATREAYRNAPSVQAAALIKDAENALYGAAKLCCPVRPLPLQSSGEGAPHNALVEIRLSHAADWRSIALGWERLLDTATSAAEREAADHQMQHALLMAESREHRAAEMEVFQ